MKGALTLCLALSCSTIANAQWTNDAAANTMVRDGANVDAGSPLMSDGPDGSTYVSWFDNGPGGFAMRMQRLDAQGYALWAANGLVVSDHPQNSATFRYDLTTDNAGNAIVAFQDERTGALRPVVYKLSPNGNFLWGNDGVELTDGLGGTGLAPAIGVLGNNNVVVAWNGDNGGTGYIPFRYITALGAVMPIAGIIEGAEDWTRPQVIAQGSSFTIQCVRQTGSFPFTNTLFAYRYDANGSALQTIQLSTHTISFFYFPQPVPDGHGGFYIAFNTGNPANGALTDLYVQRMRANGSLWNDEGTELMTGTTTQRYGGALAVLNDDDGLLLPVQVTNTAQSAGSVNVQRVDTSGAVLLGSTGVEVVAQSAELPVPFGIAATPDGALLTWYAGGFGDQHISAARVDLAGVAQWTPAELLLCTDQSNKGDPACGALVNDQLVVVWQDDRMAAGIYAQALTASGQLVLVTGLPSSGTAGMRSFTVVQDGCNSWLHMVHGALGPALLRVFDTAGRMELTERANVAAIDALIPLPTLTTGVHIVELSTAAGVDRVRVCAP